MIKFAKIETAEKPKPDKGLSKGIAAHERAKRKANRVKRKAAVKVPAPAGP